MIHFADQTVDRKALNGDNVFVHQTRFAGCIHAGRSGSIQPAIQVKVPAELFPSAIYGC